MSQLLISNYIREIETLIQFGGSADESSIRKAFSNLLDAYCKPRDLRLIDELEYVTRTKSKVYPDGTLKDSLRLTHGYWEAKDEADDLDEEIAKKRAKGYPTDNILFEDSKTAILIQNDREVMRVNMRDAEALNHLVTAFVSFERPEVSDFRRAVSNFKDDLPKVLEALREMIDAQQKSNKAFAQALKTFLKLCRDNIHADITLDDAREMLIQHILTEDIFLRIFDDSQFHRENNIARELQRVAETFFTGSTKKNTLRGLESYYGAIRQAAAGIADHHEKQGFLKAIYENFYKVYNPKLADRLGVVYTPGEIVRFMLNGTESLLHKHFGKLLQDKNVEILDPATGTGTFITDLIEHLKGNKAALEYKYKNEIHCNEIAILPYYIANLNIEFTYAQLTGKYEEFPHICFVDTIDNLGFEKTYTGQQRGLDFGLTAENTERVLKQNKRKISVIIGNPPYNANQMNENDNNKNRAYEGIDKRIKDTYIAESTAQKTKVYDMYARFFRWASDRINADGVIAFVTNNSFINARSFDGFRKCISKEFDHAYIVDLGGNIRELSGKDGIFLNEAHTVFGVAAAVGISITFLVKKVAQQKQPCQISYVHPCDIRATREEKFEWLQLNQNFFEIPFQNITPDEKGNWINLADNDFDDLLPLVSKETKAAKTAGKEHALFKLYSLGVVTARDEWVYDNDTKHLENKINFLIAAYNSDVNKLSSKSHTSDITNQLDSEIKWTRAVKNDLGKGRKYEFNGQLIRPSLYRPFVKRHIYFSKQLNEMQYQLGKVFQQEPNRAIAFSGTSSNKPFQALATDKTFSFDFLEKTQCLPLYRYDPDGNRVDNITDWGLKQFQKHYSTVIPAQAGIQPIKKSPKGQKTKPLDSRLRGNDGVVDGSNPGITKEAIFHYVYAVLHHPAYREKYALNLKREFPRIPFYDDFAQWAAWGKALMELHVGFEQAQAFELERVENSLSIRFAPPSPASGRGAGEREQVPKAKLKADKANGCIILDEATTLRGIPPEAWDYKLGNRSALEWVLDQYKETAPRDPTIREKFNTYRFADYKEHVIDLLQRVTTVSVETQHIIGQMPKAEQEET
jgi:predicted helicase